jgi:hypothetical protein
MKGNIWQVLVLIVLLVVLLPAANIAFGASNGVDTNDNVTVQYSDPVAIPNQTQYGYSDNVTIVTNDGTELARGTDYGWNSTTGNVSFQASPRTNSGDDVRVHYRYYNPSGIQAAGYAFYNAFAAVLAYWPVLVLVGAAALYGLWGNDGGGY